LFSPQPIKSISCISNFFTIRRLQGEFNRKDHETDFICEGMHQAENGSGKTRFSGPAQA